MIAMMLREPRFEQADVSSVESIRMGSAPVSESLMRAVRKAFPDAAIINAYGTTEAGPVVFGKHPDGLETPALSVGCSHAKVELRLRGDGEPEQGVLEIKCPALMNGYHNRPDLESPMTQDGFNITGDVFRRDDDGFYFFVGRSDDMFVSGGENIYPSGRAHVGATSRYRAGVRGSDRRRDQRTEARCFCRASRRIVSEQ